jgi:MFS transporter, YNFM family, putative membrane transport protein
MRSGAFLSILLAAILGISALYAPQPLLALLRDQFQVSQATASLLITVTLAPLGIAPLVFGALLESFSAKRLACAALALLALSEAAVFLAPSFWVLLLLRCCQGLLIPALLTSLMTWISTSSPTGHIQRHMALYIAATIVGGFFGRAMAGYVSTEFGWRYAFLALGVLQAGGFFLLLRQKTPPEATTTPFRSRDAMAVLRQPGFLRVYLMIFCLFFVFAALLNALPFRLTEIGTRTGEVFSEFKIGLMYSGYLMGLIASLASTRIIRLLGGVRRSMVAGLLLYLAATLLFLPAWSEVVFGAMFLFCGGMFLTHSIAPGVLNRRTQEKRGVVNGLYICFYYAGGTLGSFLPLLAYKAYGWNTFLFCLAGVVVLALIAALGPGSRVLKEKAEEQPPAPSS